jgi:hypothetical protein
MPVTLFDRLKRVLARSPGPGVTPVHVNDPRFDSWETVREFGEVRTARAWHQALIETGIGAALTADWPLDRFGRGEIYLVVEPGDWSEAELRLSNLDAGIEDELGAGLDDDLD